MKSPKASVALRGLVPAWMNTSPYTLLPWWYSLCWGFLCGCSSLSLRVRATYRAWRLQSSHITEKSHLSVDDELPWPLRQSSRVLIFYHYILSLPRRLQASLHTAGTGAPKISLSWGSDNLPHALPSMGSCQQAQS